MRIFLALLLFCGIAVGGEIEIVKGEKTALDSLVEVTIEGTRINSSKKLMVDGKVKNISNEPVGWVKVGIAAYAEDGAFLNREYVYADPKEINPQEYSYFQLELFTEKIPPVKVEYVVIIYGSPGK